MAAVLLGILVIIIGIIATVYVALYPQSDRQGENNVNTVYVSDEIKKRLDKIDANIERLDKRLSVVESAELVNVRERQEKLEKDIFTWKTIANDLEKHKRAMEEFAKIFLESDITDLKNMIKTTEAKLSVEIGERMELMLKMQQEFRDLTTEAEEKSKQVQDLQKDKKELSEILKVATENIKGISIELLVLDQRTEDMKENKYENRKLRIVFQFQTEIGLIHFERYVNHSSSTTLTVMVNTVLLAALVIICMYSQRGENMHINRDVQTPAEQANQAENDEPTQYSIAETILRQIQVRTLDKGLCVISFYEETHPLHMRMTMSVVNTFQLELVEFIVQKHVSILDIPPVCLFWIFVDSNKQNVILEDQNLGIGDLRVTTFRAIQKMGGKAVVLYVRDLDSAEMQFEQLYNPDLVSVMKHQELSALNQLSRILSAYETFTEFQKQSLRKIVVDELDLSENVSSDLSVNHSVVE